MMEQALKMEVRPFTCYLATQVFYLAIQGGLIFAFFFSQTIHPTPPWQLVYNFFLATESWQMWCD